VLGFFTSIEKDFTMLLEQIRQAKAELDHLGSCTRAGKTPDQLAEIDKRFFAAMDVLQQLRQKLASQKVR
jgi:hypothetical protein